MGKKSTAIFVSIVISIIGFTAFFSLFPHGIKMVKEESIKYEGPDTNISFYGGMKGSGSATIYAYNSTLTINNDTLHGNLLLKGEISFSSPSMLFYEGKFFAPSMHFNSSSLSVYHEGKESMYAPAAGMLEGNISMETDGLVKIGRGEENVSLLSLILPEDFTRVFPLKFERLFLINGGKVWINGREKNFSEYVFFRGEGEYSSSLFQGHAYLIASDGKFHEGGKRIFIFPLKLVILWIITIVILIISIFIKKTTFEERDEIFAGPSVIMPILFFAISFYLWNSNMELILGLNLFDIREINTVNILFILLSIVPYLVAAGIIGFPLRVATSSIFEIFGLSNVGKMVGRCLGFIFTTLWGLEMISTVLNLTLSPLLRLIA
ncbi:MAG: hypothetical protein J7L31_01040 [Thermoplasmata archaeon]|nr:hypothetical protein [Thermoplasmata archaeon]